MVGSSLLHTDQPLETFKFQWEKTYPSLFPGIPSPVENDQFGPLKTGTLEAMLAEAHSAYQEWVRLHSNRLFQLAAFCTALNKLYALNHLGSEDSEEEE